MQHITRAYNSFEINESLGLITKKSQETRLKDEIDYYLRLQDSPMRLLFPRYINCHLDVPFSLTLEYYGYNNLGLKMLNEEFDYKFWVKIAETLACHLSKFKNYEKMGHGPYDTEARNMYSAKTQKYYDELISRFPSFLEISTYREIKINNKRYLNFETIWPTISHLIETELLPLSNMYMIHGDMCFSNILLGINPQTDIPILRYVDPRGRFGEPGLYGDPRYDQAKLAHSCRGGYEYFIYNQFDIDQEGDNFYLEYSNSNKLEIEKVFMDHEIIADKSIKLIEGLIFIGMCSRHYDSLDRQKAMYITGVKLLNEILL